MKQLALCGNPQETSSILSRDIFQFRMQDQVFSQNACQKPALTGLQLELGRWQNSWNGSKETTKHMEK